MGIFYVFILGLLIGSFINAVVYRLRQGKSFIWARSICPSCSKQLKWYELVPLFSFLWQRGKCNYCQRPISIHYPLVETATAVIFSLIYWQLAEPNRLTPLAAGDLIYLVGFFILVVFLIIIFLYDVKYYLILDKVTLPAMAAALLWNLVRDLSWMNFSNLVLAAVAGGGFFLLQFIISRGKWIGGGDIRLGALMGFILGLKGLIVALMLAYIIGAIFSIFMLLLKKKRWGSQIPFGTFLSLGTFMAMLWASELVDWYLGLL